MACVLQAQERFKLWNLHQTGQLPDRATVCAMVHNAVPSWAPFTWLRSAGIQVGSRCQ